MGQNVPCWFYRSSRSVTPLSHGHGAYIPPGRKMPILRILLLLLRLDQPLRLGLVYLHRQSTSTTVVALGANKERWFCYRRRGSEFNQYTYRDFESMKDEVALFYPSRFSYKDMSWQ